MADQDFNIKVITTADTSGITQTAAGLTQIQQMQAAAAQQGLQASASAQAAAYQLGQSLRVVAGGAVIAAGYQLVSKLNEAAVQIEKISTELGKQGGQIIDNARKFTEMAQSAETQADVLKTGESAIKDIGSAHAKSLEISGQELTTWQKIQDIWTSGFDVFNRGVSRPQADALKIAQEISSQNDQMARTAAKAAVSLAEAYKEGFDKKKIEPFSQSIEELTNKIEEQEELQKKVGKENIESYIAIGKTVEVYKKQLEEILKLEKAHNKAIEDKAKALKEANKRAGEATARAAVLSAKQNQTPAEQEEANKAEKEAAEARNEARRQEDELREQKRAEARRTSDFAEVKKYGRVLDPSERASETIKEREELGQKAGQAQNKELQERLADQMTEQLRGISPEQLKNEREAKGIKPTAEKDTSQGIIRAIENLNQKFDRYWQ